jgi:hypothetical protein
MAFHRSPEECEEAKPKEENNICPTAFLKSSVDKKIEPNAHAIHLDKL